MNRLIDIDYYKEHPEYSEVPCIHCKQTKLRIIGIECFTSDYNSSDDYEKTLYQCENCGQQAYIEIEWVFSVSIPRDDEY